MLCILKICKYIYNCLSYFYPFWVHPETMIGYPVLVVLIFRSSAEAIVATKHIIKVPKIIIKKK